MRRAIRFTPEPGITLPIRLQRRVTDSRLRCKDGESELVNQLTPNDVLDAGLPNRARL